MCFHLWIFYSKPPEFSPRFSLPVCLSTSEAIYNVMGCFSASETFNWLTINCMVFHCSIDCLGQSLIYPLFRTENNFFCYLILILIASINYNCQKWKRNKGQYKRWDFLLRTLSYKMKEPNWKICRSWTSFVLCLRLYSHPTL